MGALCSTRRDDPKPRGCDDVPGYARLPSWSSLLYVGNQRSAWHGDFETVISATIPKGPDGHQAPSMMTHAILFDDLRGSESRACAAFARSRIIDGAKMVAAALKAGKKTLVHCEWGQNRSCSICCAYAVIFLRWTADAVIHYVRERNLSDRRYKGQTPPRGAMCNSCFNEIIYELEGYSELPEKKVSERSSHSRGMATPGCNAPVLQCFQPVCKLVRPSSASATQAAPRGMEKMASMQVQPPPHLSGKYPPEQHGASWDRHRVP